MGALDSLYLRNASQWAPFYAILQQELGNTATLLDFGNQSSAGKVDASTWTGRRFHANGLAPTWTPSEALSAWDTPFDLTDPDNWLGLAPILTFNGSDEEADTPDAAGWTNAGAISWGGWINLTAAANNVILSKWDETSGAEAREWIIETDGNGDFGAQIYDETNNAAVGRKVDTALTTGRWYFWVVTFDGGTDASGMNIYLDGVDSDDANIVDDAGFADMVDTATVVALGYDESTGGAKENFFDGKMLGGPWSPFKVDAELTAAQVKNLFENLRLGLGV